MRDVLNAMSVSAATAHSAFASFKNPRTLVSRFRSSQHFTEPRFELRNRKDTSKPIDLVWLWFRSPHNEFAASLMRTSEPPHQAGSKHARQRNAPKCANGLRSLAPCRANHLRGT